MEFNKTVTYQSVKQEVAPIPADHDPADRVGAMALAESNDPVYQGVYHRASAPTFHDNVEAVLQKLG